MTQNIHMDPTWKTVLSQEFEKPYFSAIKQFLLNEKNAGYVIYPAGPNIFAAFNLTPFDKVKVVILGQDPYHGEGEAHGLCFSVQDGIKQPPSLKNIFKELQEDCSVIPPSSGNLTRRAEQGVLLLNSTLTVRKDTPNSHKDIGWQEFTDAAISALSNKRDHLVFILRGAYAQSKLSLIDTSRHLVLQSPHPSPFSCYKGFFGSHPFSKTNDYLIANTISPIVW
ncbi:MAG: uracil-DNA glycosylase [Candidatus Absconditabacteria bacterium]